MIVKRVRNGVRSCCEAGLTADVGCPGPLLLLKLLELQECLELSEERGIHVVHGRGFWLRSVDLAIPNGFLHTVEVVS